MSRGGSGEGRPDLLPVLWNPVGTLQGVAGARRALPGFAVVAGYAAFGFVVSAVFAVTGATRRAIGQQSAPPGIPPNLSEGLARATEIGAPILALLSPFLLWISVSLLMQLTTRPFGGTGPLSSMLGVVGVAQVPLLVGGMLNLLVTSPQLFLSVGPRFVAVLGYASSLITLLFFLWHVALVVVGAAQARRLDYGESAGACALSCLGLGILIILLVVLAGVGVFTVVGASSR